MFCDNGATGQAKNDKKGGKRTLFPPFLSFLIYTIQIFKNFIYTRINSYSVVPIPSSAAPGDTDLPVGIGPDLVKMVPGFVPMLFKLAV